MPTYFFHVRVGNIYLEDKEGIELQDLEAALAEARQSAREMAADDLRANQPVDGRKIEIANENRELLEVVAIRDVLD